MKMFKKIVAVVLVISMLSLLPLSASALSIDGGLDALKNEFVFGEGPIEDDYSIVEIAEVLDYEKGRFILNTLVKQNKGGQVDFTGNKIVQTRKMLLKGEEYLDELRSIGIELS